MILRLDPPVWMETPRGQALCHFLIDRGIEFDNEWICFHNDGQIWNWMNYDVRVSQNVTIGRFTVPSKTQRQRRFMAIASHNPSFARKAGIPVKTAQEFHAADRGKKYGAGGKRGKRK